jgi:hypothetical protein
MGRRMGESTPRDRAIAWSKDFVSTLAPGDSVAILLAKDRVQGLVDPPSFDRSKLLTALDSVPPALGSSDLSLAISESFRILETTQNPGREVIVLGDNHRVAWRPDEPGRWALLRALRSRLSIAPRLWAIDFTKTEQTQVEQEDTSSNGSVIAVELSRGTVVPGLPLFVTATIKNSGPSILTRPIELLLDGQPISNSRQTVGPIPVNGQTTVRFQTSLDEIGSHLITTRLARSDDPQPDDDESSRPVSVTPPLPVLLVDGAPDAGPLRSEVSFLRAALAPNGDEAPVVTTRVIDQRKFTELSLKNQKVVVLANVDSLGSELTSALDAFVAAGGGLVIAPGDRTLNNLAGDITWLPASIESTKGSLKGQKPIAHPSPSTFTGPSLTPLAQGDHPPLSDADFFVYHVIRPDPNAAVIARLDTGDPWIVERPHGRGRVIMLSTALDADVGTLPVNPDFVPLIHELMLSLAGTSLTTPTTIPGEPIVIDRAGLNLPLDAKLMLTRPNGTTSQAPITQNGETTRVVIRDAFDPGVYRLTWPNPPGGSSYAVVSSDPRENQTGSLSTEEAASLQSGWPLVFENHPENLPILLNTGSGAPRHEIWRGLVLAALAGLCIEIAMTRRLARKRGLT